MNTLKKAYKSAMQAHQIEVPASLIKPAPLTVRSTEMSARTELSDLSGSQLIIPVVLRQILRNP